MKNEFLKKTLLNEILSPQLSRSERSKLKIIDTAIETFAATTADDLSYEEIARRGKLNRSLVNYYFPQRKDLFLTVMKYIRALYQELAVTEFSKTDDPKEMIELYVRSTFSWINKTPEHVKVWILFWFLASADQDLKDFHKGLTEMGKERIIAIIENLKIPHKKNTKKELTFIAKSIQRIITGTIIEAMTEPTDNLKVLEQDVVRQCLDLVGL